MDSQRFLQTILPAGEWSNIKVVNGDGMMRDRNWAILATADWQRRGGLPAFIKFIHAAGPAAGPTTFLVTDPDRLKQVEERLNEIRKQPEIPLVQILDLRMVLDKGLLLAMERVEVVQSLIDQGKAGKSIAVRILQHLDPDERAGSRAWHHFDVCARNIGIRRDGKPVLIDVESIYLENDGQIPVTVPAFKPWRLPGRLKDEVVSSAIAKGMEIHLPTQLALRKFRSEIIVAAAECCFGPISPSVDPIVWLERFRPDPHADILERALRRLEAGESIRLATVATELEAVMAQATKPEVHIVQNQVHIVQNQVATPAERAARNAPVESVQQDKQVDEKPSGWELAFRELDETARALRRGELRLDEITKYRERLEAIVDQHPEAAPVWNELLLVAVSYERNRDLAFAIADKAHAARKDDRGFQQWRQILSVWRVD